MRQTDRAVGSARQNGAVLLVVVAIIGLGIMAVLVGRLNSADIANRRIRSDQEGLAQARDALIAWSLQRGRDTGTERPGELPCPDTNNDGIEEGTCAAGRLGRVPWRTLGIDAPRDSASEILWYAPAGTMRKYNSNSNPINSNTRGNLAVYAANGTSVIRSDAVLVLFAPGAPLATQDRSNTLAACSTTGTTIVRSNCASNYLDSANGRNNSTNSGPFITGDRSVTFNDAVMLVTTDDFIHQIEQRVALEAKLQLKKYETTNGFLPFPAKHNDAGCLDLDYLSNCTSGVAICRGRFPDNALTAITPDWAIGGRPDWFSYNLWGDSIYYAVGTSRLKAAPANCSLQQTVGTSQYNAVLIFPGAAQGSTVRPSANLSNYLEDTENLDGWTGVAPDADRLVVPSSVSNDRLYLY